MNRDKIHFRAVEFLAHRRGLIVAAVGFALLATGCTQTESFHSAGDLARPVGTTHVLLMPPDISLAEVTAAGLLEPNAEWTQMARPHILNALREMLGERNAELVTYQEAPPDSEAFHAATQLVKLHNAVGRSIIIHKYAGGNALPTKEDKFDWSLGSRATLLRDDYGADYALFVYLRDSYASAGRVAMIVIRALLLSYVPGGQQFGFASLVDLHTGGVVWVNMLSSETGDLREAEAAREACERLLDEFPL
jgi:hypothetical protein